MLSCATALREFLWRSKKISNPEEPPEYEYFHQVNLVLALTALNNLSRGQAQGREDRFYREADAEWQNENLAHSGLDWVGT